jgi:hypothetical protein
MTATPRVCLFCKHCCYSEATPDYSEYTPGEPSSLSCEKHRFPSISYVDGDRLRAAIVKAVTCTDWSPMDVKA